MHDEAARALRKAYEAILAARDACTEENTHDYLVGLEDAADIVLRLAGVEETPTGGEEQTSGDDGTVTGIIPATSPNTTPARGPEEAGTSPSRAFPHGLDAANTALVHGSTSATSWAGCEGCGLALDQEPSIMRRPNARGELGALLCNDCASKQRPSEGMPDTRGGDECLRLATKLGDRFRLAPIEVDVHVMPAMTAAYDKGVEIGAEYARREQRPNEAVPELAGRWRP